MDINRPFFAQLLPHELCQGIDHLHNKLAQVEAQGGEGLMLRQPGSKYEAGRSRTLLKVKRFHDAEALVVGHQPGRGRHQGRLGALLVELANGTGFAVGTGLSDAERETPPSIGSIITFKYQELSDGGVPRFPSFVGVRSDSSNSLFQGEPSMQGKTKKRRFEFVQGNSAKFWEISVSANEINVQFGRIGTAGQANAKSFPDEEAAAKHVNKVIGEKLGKGYVEVV